MEKQIEITTTGTFNFKYNPESSEFKEALASFADMIDSAGEEEDMLKHITHSVRQWGWEHLVEGVGYISRAGRKVPEKGWCGVEVEDDEPDFEYNIE